MSDPDVFDLLRELDPALGSEPPGSSSASARRIRRRIAAGAGEGRGRRLVRLAVIVGGALLVLTGIAIATVSYLDRSVILQSEGRELEQGTESLGRSITVDGATWTVIGYGTTDGYSCVDFELTIRGVFEGSIGDCGERPVGPFFGGGSGGVRDGETMRVLLTGSSDPTITRVTATDVFGHTLTDQPVDGIWLIVPRPDTSSWVVEAFDANGDRVARIDIEHRS
ncbi:MAG: hypothetical protein IIB04_06175 [Acidobacteria bacterium]|nr:hypothetical protein [Acidobacteriota bacterium]MCH8986183.1 hypothetical protein [Acidobacteriota bacterium]